MLSKVREKHSSVWSLSEYGISFQPRVAYKSAGDVFLIMKWAALAVVIVCVEVIIAGKLKLSLYASLIFSVQTAWFVSSIYQYYVRQV